MRGARAAVAPSHAIGGVVARDEEASARTVRSLLETMYAVRNAGRECANFGRMQYGGVATHLRWRRR